MPRTLHASLHATLALAQLARVISAAATPPNVVWTPSAAASLPPSDPALRARLQEDVRGRWHSQVGQDRAAYAVLGRKERGYFVDCAANEPVHLSNSRALERDHGWRGLCIEANPYYWPLLRTVRSCAVVGTAVASDEREVGFTAAAEFGGLTGLLHGPSSTKLAPNEPRFTEEPRADFTARTVPLSSILAAFGAPPTIDYMSLDVEGAEGLVMASFPWHRHNISVLTVERPKAELRAALASHGYGFVCTAGGFGDELWVHTASVPPSRYRGRAVPCRGEYRCEGLVDPNYSCGAEERARAAPAGGQAAAAPVDSVEAPSALQPPRATAGGGEENAAPEATTRHDGTVRWSGASSNAAHRVRTRPSIYGPPLQFERREHPFLRRASQDVWLCSSCETTTWVLQSERALSAAMNRSLSCALGRRDSMRAAIARSQRPIVVDVGSNCGVYSVAAATCGYEVFAFEVQPQCIEMLRATLRMNRVPVDAYHVSRHPVSDGVRELTLPLADSCTGTYSFSRRDGQYFTPLANETMTLQTRVLSDALPPTREIALLKIDTEGHDPQVLRGALPLFRERRVRLATVEASPFMWTAPFDPELAGVFRDAMLAGYHALCLSLDHEIIPRHLQLKVTADTVVQQMSRRGELARCVDLLLCRDDVSDCTYFTDLTPD